MTAEPMPEPTSAEPTPAQHGETTPEPTILEPEKKEETEPLEEPDTASVSHIMTNAILLQSFLFELAAVLQARASLFGEVRYA